MRLGLLVQPIAGPPDFRSMVVPEVEHTFGIQRRPAARRYENCIIIVDCIGIVDDVAMAEQPAQRVASRIACASGVFGRTVSSSGGQLVRLTQSELAHGAQATTLGESLLAIDDEIAADRCRLAGKPRRGVR